MILRRRGRLGGGMALSYLFKDLFTTAESAPLPASRDAEPIGELLIVDSNSIINIVDGSLVIDGTASSNDGAVIGDGAGSPKIFTRADGLAMGYELTDTSDVGTGIRFGFGSTALTDGNIYGFDFNAGQVRPQDGVTAIASYGVDSLNTRYFVCIIGTRAFLIVDDLILWVIDSINSNLYGKLRLGASTMDFAIGRMAVVDDGLSTTRGDLLVFEIPGALVGNEVNDTRYGDWFMQRTITTLPSSGAIRWGVRYDGTTITYYEMRVNSAGTCLLGSVVNGGAFSLIASSGSFANNAVLKVHCEGSTIKVMVNGSTLFTFSSAVYADKTGHVMLSLGTGGAVSNVICWNHPRNVSEAKNILRAI